MDIKIFDSHFHLFNSKINTSIKNNNYNINNYLDDYKFIEKNATLCGGICVEALSACYPDKNEEEYNKYCEAEISWISKQIKNNNNYFLISPIALESKFFKQNIQKLIKLNNCVGVRQILNFNPSWPRNKLLGNLLLNKQWINGLFILSDAKINFDIQINPHQFKDTYNLIKNIKSINFIIDHIGHPLITDFYNNKEYWDGLKLFAKLDNVFIKISRLSYIHNDWDKIESIRFKLLNAINIFGDEKILFGSNLPIENKFNYDAKRIVESLSNLLLENTSLKITKRFFYNNAYHAYKIN